jgi:hypothetical protein
MRIRGVALVVFVVLGVLFGSVGSVSARDDKLTFSIHGALDRAEFKQKLDPGVQLYFGATWHAAPTEDKGIFKTNKKTRAFGRSDQDACDWAFLSALLQLQERARQMGANAVVEIESVYKNTPLVSEKEYLCGAGGMMSGVALNGRIVKLAAKK